MLHLSRFQRGLLLLHQAARRTRLTLRSRRVQHSLKITLLILLGLTLTHDGDPDIGDFSTESSFDLPAHSVRPDAGRWADSIAIISANHLLTSPLGAGFHPGELARIRSIIRSEIERGAFPGATLAVGRYTDIVMEEGFGRETWSNQAVRVDPHRSVYDLASLTKVVATTTAAMLLYEDGKLNLNDPVQKVLPTFRGEGRERVTFRHLLTHTAGLSPGIVVGDLSAAEARAKALNSRIFTEPGSKMEYSDLGFIILAMALEELAQEPLDSLLERRVWSPLRMRSTGFRPNPGCRRCVPTLLLQDGRVFRAKVHDPIARKLGGEAGHAGLFSTAHDLGRFASMLASEGSLRANRILRPETIRTFTQLEPGTRTRAIGWEKPNPDGTGAAGLRLSRSSFGHTGFTGTSLWIDPERGIWLVFLTNRVYNPRAKNEIQRVRRTLHSVAAASADAYDRMNPRPTITVVRELPDIPEIRSIPPRPVQGPTGSQ